MQDTPSRSVTISIVSHGQQALILPLLEQLSSLCATSINAVVLTINIAEPDLVDDGAYRFPIRRIVNCRPHGFGANHNAAFAQCETGWFLVLNPDIRLDTDVLAPLLAQARPRDGVLAPRIWEPAKAALEPHRALLTPWEILRRRKAHYAAPPRPAWIPGMFMLWRSEAYRRIRGFDPRFFMYGEDYDICARLQLAGWTIGIGEDWRVEHSAQRASHRSWRHLYWHAASLLRVWCSPAFWRYAWRERVERARP